MSTHITTTYVNNAIGSSELTALMTSEGTSTALTQLIQAASSIVDSALSNSGYTPPTSSAPDMVKAATLGALLPLLYSRKQIAIPEGYQVYLDSYSMIRDGRFPVPGLTPNSRDAVGGVSFSDSDSSVSDGGRPKVYDKLRENY